MIYTITTYGPREYLCRLGLLSGELEFRPKRILVADIQKAVARHFGMRADVMKAANKGVREVARARQIAIYLAHRFTQQSTPQIGRLFNRDHSTVLHSIKQVTARKETDAELANDLRMIKRELLA